MTWPELVARELLLREGVIEIEPLDWPQCFKCGAWACVAFDKYPELCLSCWYRLAVQGQPAGASRE
jgi:hypothetical protein